MLIFQRTFPASQTGTLRLKSGFTIGPSRLLFLQHPYRLPLADQKEQLNTLSCAYSALPRSILLLTRLCHWSFSAQFRCWTESTLVVEKEIPVLFDTNRFLSKKAMQPPKPWRELQLSIGEPRNARVNICLERSFLVAGETATLHLDIVNHSPKSAHTRCSFALC